MKIKKEILTTVTFSFNEIESNGREKIDVASRNRNRLSHMLCSLRKANDSVLSFSCGHYLNHCKITIMTELGDDNLGETLLKPLLKEFFKKYDL